MRFVANFCLIIDWMYNILLPCLIAHALLSEFLTTLDFREAEFAYERAHGLSSKQPNMEIPNSIFSNKMHNN